MNLRQFFASNRWWGKLLGCFFGYLIAGPIGALFGLILGNFFDRGLAVHFGNPHWYYHAEKREAVQQLFFEATFTVMGYIAKSDGRVSEEELDMARQMMREMRLDQAHVEKAKKFFNAGKQTNYLPDAIIRSLRMACEDRFELIKLFMDIQYRAAQVDGLTSQKVQALNRVFQLLGYAPLHNQYRYYEDFGRQQQSSSQRQSYSNTHRSQTTYTSNSLAEAYALLEVSQTASKQEVKRAYRRSISRNHPDKLIAQGLPEEMIKLANDKTQRITKAYELICESKGW